MRKKCPQRKLAHRPWPRGLSRPRHCRSHMSAVHPSNVGYGQGNSTAEDEEEGAELLQDDTAEDADMNALIEELKLRDFRLTYCGVDMSKGECGEEVWLGSVVGKCAVPPDHPRGLTPQPRSKAIGAASVCRPSACLFPLWPCSSW